MKAIHTSDWHLGRRLGGRSRHDESAAFLDWLAETVRREQVSLLLVAGDVFDNGTPSGRTQELYYGFLFKAVSAGCRHIVITGGNHDSPSLLDAPGTLLRRLGVHVMGAPGDVPSDEVIVLRDAAGKTEAVVCAVPYLPDRVLRTSEAGESPEDKNTRLLEGLRRHYTEVCGAGAEIKEAAGGGVPLIAMGHLFAAGGRRSDGDGVRELSIGTILRADASIFPPSVDYVALGHLHLPQIVAGNEFIRYAGSPLPMGFGEAGQEKQVVLLDFEKNTPSVRPIPVPCFRELARVAGTLPEILERLTALKESGREIWLEVVYSGDEFIPDLGDRIEALLDGSGLSLLILRTGPLPGAGKALPGDPAGEVFPDETGLLPVFDQYMEAHSVPEPDREELRQTYREAVACLQEKERDAV